MAEIIAACITAVAGIIAAIIGLRAAVIGIRARKPHPLPPLPDPRPLPPHSAPAPISPDRPQESGRKFMSDEYFAKLNADLQLNVEEGDDLELSEASDLLERRGDS